MHFLLRAVTVYSAFFISSCVSNQTDIFPRAVSVNIDETPILITAPDGFCIDQGTAKKVSNSITLFAVDCIIIKIENGFSSARRPVSSILTATISKSGQDVSNNLDDLLKFLTTKQGLKMLSRSETINPLKVHSVEKLQDLILFYSEQRVDGTEVNGSPFFWRALFFLDNHIVSLTANNFIQNKNSKLRLKKLIVEFSNNIKASNVDLNT